VDRKAAEEEGRVEDPLREPARDLAVDVPAAHRGAAGRARRDVADQGRSERRARVESVAFPLLVIPSPSTAATGALT